MPTLSQVAAHTRHATVPWGELSIQIDYHPGRLTGNLIAEVEANCDMETISKALIDLLAAWDLTEDDGVTMFPLDQDRFGEIGLSFMTAVFYAMVSDMRPEALTPKK